MKRQKIIVYKSEIPEIYGNLRLFCDIKGIKYNTYVQKKMPFNFNGIEVHRVKFISGSFKNNLKQQL